MLNQAEITATIKSIPWFFDLTHQNIERLSEIASVHVYEPGDTVFSEGEQHPFLYIVLDGKVTLESFVPGHGKVPILLAEPLDVIGWSSCTPIVRQRTCTARALTSIKLLALQADSLMKCCENHPDLGFIIMRRLANVVASRLLNHRLHLLEIISCQND